MNRQGLPGIETLFREQDRLAKKLSQEELNALRRYIHRAVHTECESVIARMRYLQSAQEVNEAQYQHALGTLQRDLHVQQSVAGEFRREFGSLARVLQAREERQKAKCDTLVRQIVHGREEVENAVKAMEKLEAELQEKEKELNQQKDLVVDLEDQLTNHKDCHKLRPEIAQLNKDLLKTKHDNDKLRTKLAESTAKLDKAVSKSDLPKPVSDSKHSSSPKIKSHVRFAPTIPAPKNSPVTFTPVTPYCTSNTCRARMDLEECRVQFIQKCEEVVYLKTALAEQKTKISRERKHAFAVTPSIKPSEAVQPLKPTCPKGKDSAGPALSSGTNNARLCASMKFKLGPIFPAVGKK
ncbi:hypothetical protein ACOMHN_059500 [Nucella lapillus]